ncbi:MAG: bifunctional 5,10-methylenetetrahydrofolate dehydrogenase/5,10-methenyltetrahydrofolate cyclohydrolase [bacterium]|nr:bifunctional 5,10-methylenetetrahydrofolate dehydrogenase/5,10-methenyltetrahydrofolate cyclohydrolase [bacterium]
MEIIDGRKISKIILEDTRQEVEKLHFVPVFCDILVGNDFASVQYVNLKKKKAQEFGIKFYDANFAENITTKELLKEIEKINKIENMCGIIVQLPLPPHIDTRKILDSILPSLDVDCLGSVQSGEFYSGGLYLAPPTALACMRLLESLKLDESLTELKVKNIVVLGEGKLVGRPVAQLLKNKNLPFVVLNSKSENKEEIIKNADVIISGIGRGKFITGEMVKMGVIIIDAGTSEEEGSVIGDTDFESVGNVASFVTPVPGGVGPVTVAELFSNVLKVAKRK